MATTLGDLVIYREPGPEMNTERIGAYFANDDADHGVAGYVDHTPQPDGSTHIRIVHVDDDRRRMGVASRLMDELERDYPRWTTDYFTDDGMRFFARRKDAHGG